VVAMHNEIKVSYLFDLTPPFITPYVIFTMSIKLTEQGRSYGKEALQKKERR